MILVVQAEVPEVCSVLWTLFSHSWPSTDQIQRKSLPSYAKLCHGNSSYCETLSQEHWTKMLYVPFEEWHNYRGKKTFAFLGFHKSTRRIGQMFCIDEVIYIGVLGRVEEGEGTFRWRIWIIGDTEEDFFHWLLHQKKKKMLSKNSSTSCK